MELVEIEGDLFDSDADILCHQVNCCGCIGGGISGQFISKEPKVLSDYRERFTAGVVEGPNGEIELPAREDYLGQVIFTPHKNQFYASIFGQLDFGFGPRFTDYDALERGMIAVRDFAIQHEPYLSAIAFPKYIGCGLAGGKWDKVYEIIQRVFENFDGVIEIWEYRPM